MTPLQELIKLYTSPASKFFMPMNEFVSELATLAPYILNAKHDNLKDVPERREAAILPSVAGGVFLTDDYGSADVANDSIAYYRIDGTIVANESWWRSSTKTLQKDLLSADSNSKISAHFLHISSGGGEAWYLEQLAETIRSLNKPAHAFVERIAGSAAYYIASQCGHISASTRFDVVGSIGTMVSFMDMQPMFEKWGVNFIEEYASHSDLKNKKVRDLINGEPAQFISEELDPLAEQFINDVRLARPALAKLDLGHPAFRGETFYSDKAQEIGLIDDIESLSAAITRLVNSVSVVSRSKKNNRSKALQLLNL